MLALVTAVKASLAGATLRTAPAWGYVLLCRTGFTHGYAAVENSANTSWIGARHLKGTLTEGGVSGPPLPYWADIFPRFGWHTNDAACYQQRLTLRLWPGRCRTDWPSPPGSATRCHFAYRLILEIFVPSMLTPAINLSWLKMIA